MFNKQEDFIHVIYKNKTFLEALYIASPDLFKQFQNASSVKKEKLFNALMRYLLRMSFRPTPFGLFSGIGSFNFIAQQINGVDFRIELDSCDSQKKYLELDMQVIGALIEKILKNKIIRSELKFYPNNSIYQLGNQLRYLEYEYRNKSRKYQMSEVLFDEFMNILMQITRNGATIKSIIESFSINESDTLQYENFILSLIDTQILVSELELSVTGENSGRKLLKQLKNIPSAKKYYDALRNILMQIDVINKSNLGFDIMEYEKIVKVIKELDIPYEKSKLFQMVLNNRIKKGKTPKYITKSILKNISLLRKLNNKSDKTILDSFCEAYYERYEEQEMPLLEVLDLETGIGFPVERNISNIAPLVDDIPVPNNATLDKIELSAVDDFLLHHIQESLKNDAYEIELNMKKLQNLPKPELNLPSTFSAMASVVYLNNKEFIYLQSAGGSSANQLLGRFCHADESIEKLCKSIAAHEDNIMGDAIRAEIVHVPESRLGNILQRSVLSDYEIPYLAKSALSSDFQIEVSDLMISVKDKEITLRSKKLDKQVIPVLSSAHNFSTNSLPVYHFLCSLQLHNMNTSLNFHWGNLKDKFQFLPRVVNQNVILSPATWQLSKESYKEIVSSTTDELLIQEVKLWQHENKMPRFIAIADGDNELNIDLENFFCLKVLQEELKKRTVIILIESFVNLEKSFVKSKKGLFAHQLVFSFMNHERQVENYLPKNEIQHTRKIKRTFIPGEEWVYYKFYCGISVSDTILKQVVQPLAKQLSQQDIIDEWFFIRYGDPNHHIRLRFKLEQKHSLNDIVSKVKFHIQPFVSNRLIHKVQLDTYIRELERYSPKAIEQAEKMFFFDSRLIVDLLKEDINSNDIWKIAVYNIHKLFEDFQLSFEERINLSALLKQNFYEEYGLTKGNKVTRKKINNKYRKLQNNIQKILTDADIFIEKYKHLFQNRSNLNHKLIKEVKNILEFQEFQNFLTSIIHMSLNRLLATKQRQQEMIIYDYINRAYISLIKQNILKNKDIR